MVGAPIEPTPLDREWWLLYRSRNYEIQALTTGWTLSISLYQQYSRKIVSKHRLCHKIQQAPNLIDLLEIITGLSGEAVMISNTFSVITGQI